MIISIPASQREHELITTNPVEGDEQSNIGHEGADSPAAVESYELTLSQQKTVPLPLIQGQEHAADASHNGTFK